MSLLPTTRVPSFVKFPAVVKFAPPWMLNEPPEALVAKFASALALVLLMI